MGDNDWFISYFVSLFCINYLEQHVVVLRKEKTGVFPLLQIHPPQHQEGMAVPHPGGGAGSGPDSCHLMPGLLQLAPGCNSSRMQQLSPTPNRFSAPCTGYWWLLDLIQDTGTCLPCCEWVRPILYLGRIYRFSKQQTTKSQQFAVLAPQ